MLDEPTAFLDFPGKVALLRLLGRLSSVHGKTILFSTHDLELALQLACRLWVLSADGLTEGPPQALAADGTIARLFAGDGLQCCADAFRRGRKRCRRHFPNFLSMTPYL